MTSADPTRSARRADMSPAEYQAAAIQTTKPFLDSDPQLPRMVRQLQFGASYAASEAGELLNRVNKVVYQGHPLDTETVAGIVEEIGDGFWGLMVALDSLGVTPEQAFAANRAKLDRRYPTGHFTLADSLARVDHEEYPDE